jgi:hypothetical protein
MKKVVFAIFALALSTACASAQIAFNTPTATATIAVNATIQQSASLTLSGNSVNFNVLDATVPTNGDKAITVTSKVSIAKGHAATMEIGSTDLVGLNGGGTIPAELISYKTGVSLGFNPLYNDPAMNGILAINTNSGALLNATPAGLTTPISFQLAAVPTYVPDQYTGTVTIILFVL